MASSVCAYGAHLKQGKGWVKSLSDEEREVTFADPLRAGYGGRPGVQPVQCSGVTIIYCSSLLPPLSAPGCRARSFWS